MSFRNTWNGEVFCEKVVSLLREGVSSVRASSKAWSFPLFRRRRRFSGVAGVGFHGCPCLYILKCMRCLCVWEYLLCLLWLCAVKCFNLLILLAQESERPMECCWGLWVSCEGFGPSVSAFFLLSFFFLMRHTRHIKVSCTFKYTGNVGLEESWERQAAYEPCVFKQGFVILTGKCRLTCICFKF